ncbi:H ACA ribonucleo complex non-core subunit NAF1 [Labeo rohita]|uniref:H ACA ribonucleo complex non-core subunit NAF1 n=1 Tax=Labeo rohita TaxID=84645 RepID=A0A498LXE9_LABRO|nr:H ACA ribonucleo complex non-core subunit NAF1 [Labeo rohita]
MEQEEAAAIVEPYATFLQILHEESISFLILPEATVDILLGRPWLEEHNPHIRWSTEDGKTYWYFKC